jgi:hypothetical protein
MLTDLYNEGMWWAIVKQIQINDKYNRFMLHLKVCKFQ